jgi:four helix bundle protein
MKKPDFENLEVYQLAEKLANEIWNMVEKWDSFAKDSIGKQIVRSADSIGANIAEGNGRYNSKDNERFIKIARGSLYETIHWLRVVSYRKLITNTQIERIKPIIDELSPKLNAYFQYFRKQKNNPTSHQKTIVREQDAPTPPLNNQQSSINNQQSTINHQPSTINHQPSIEL